MATGITFSTGAGIGSYPYAIAYDSGTGQAFIANDFSNNVSVISDVNDSVVTSVGVGSDPDAVAYDSATGEVFVANSGSNNVTVISDVNDSVVTSVPVGSDPDGVGFDPGIGEVFVANSGSDNVSVISDINDSVVTSVMVGNGPSAVTYDSGTAEVFVANEFSGNVSVISEVNDSVVASVPVGVDPDTVAYDLGTGQVFVGNCVGNPSDPVSVIDGSNDTVVTTVAVGSCPTGLAYDPGTGEVFVANLDSNNVSVISDVDDSAITWVPVGSNPQAIAYDSGTGQLFVANSNSDNLSVFAPGGSATALFRVDPSVLLMPPSGDVGTTVSAMGVGFAPNSSIAFAFAGGAVLSTCSTDSTGRFPGTSGTSCVFSVPASPEGPEDLVASDGTTTANATFSVNSTLTLSSTRGAVGSTIYVMGAGFAADRSVSITFAGVTVVSSCSTDSTGSFPGGSGTPCTLLLPAAPKGLNTVTASDGTNSLNASYFVTTDLGLSPANGTVGSTVAVSGFGFSADAPETFTFAGVAVPSACSTDSTGSFPGTSGTACTLTVPASPGGPQTLSATDGTYTETAVFFVNETMSLSPITGPVGTLVTARGTGALGNSSVTFTFGGVAVNSACSTDSTGTVPGSSGTPCTFAVPGAPEGSEIVAVFGGAGFAGSVPVGSDPNSVGYDSATGQLFVANDGSNNVSVISVVNDSVVTSVAVGNDPDAVAYDSGTGLVFVANSGSDNVSAISAVNDSVLASIPVGSGHSALAYDSGTAEVFVADSGSDEVTVISVVNDSVVTSVPVGSFPYAVAYDPATGQVFVANLLSDNVSVISDVNDSTVASVPVGNSPDALAYDSATREMFVANSGSGNLSVIWDVDDSVVASVPVGSDPEAVAYDLGTGQLFVAAYGPGQVDVISQANDSIVASLATGPGSSGSPDAIAYDAGTGQMFIANSNSDNVSVIAAYQAASLFTVDPRVVVDTPSDSADVGQTVTVEGSGYGSSLRISTFSLGAFSLACTEASTGTCVGGVLTTAPNGSFVAEAVVPAVLASGSYTVSVNDSAGNSANTTIYVDTDLSVGPIAATRTTVDVGQSTTFSVAVSFGAGGDRFAWSGLPTGCSAAQATVACTPTSRGNYTISVQVTDSNGGSVTSSPLTYVVYADPTVSTPVGTPGSRQVDAGQVVTFATSASLGTGTYSSFQWEGLPSGCSGTTATVTCSGANLREGTDIITVNVTDSDQYNSTRSSALYYVVASDPTLTGLVASRGSADVGQSVTFSSTAALGSGNYTYAWSGLPTGCTGVPTASVICATNGARSFSVTLEVTDSNGFEVASGPLSFTVYSDPSASLSASRTAFDAGQMVTLTALAGQGSGNFTYSWNGLSASCTGTGPVITCTPPAAGVFSVQVWVTDSNGVSIHSAAVVLTVAAPLSASISVTPASPMVGQSVTLTSGASGGTGAIAYSWVFGDGSREAGDTVDHAYTTAGTFTVSLWVNDSSGASVEKTLAVTVSNSSVATPAWSSGEIWAGLGLAVIAAALALAALLFLRNRARKPGSSEPTWEGVASDAESTPDPGRASETEGLPDEDM
ncbi:MAG: PKD domain-containing protein [Thermoplasmata archaeon]|nr:PKD domain-containing protein [Thermoplasmata archaeon]